MLLQVSQRISPGLVEDSHANMITGISVIFQRREVAGQHHPGLGRDVSLEPHLLQRLPVGFGQGSYKTRELRSRL
jgi:hypothetical protein